jgi:outer membrane protein OmpA-like peptidoglycan-associated protein
MRTLLIGASLLALAAAAPPAAEAQQGTGDPASARSGEAAPGSFLVFFDLGSAALTRDGRETVAEAARDYQRTGAARLSLAGHADSSGDEAYNRRLSERRAEAVRAELVRLGVPGEAITAVAQGEDVPLVETADGTREARNRRVEIVVRKPRPWPRRRRPRPRRPRWPSRAGRRLPRPRRPEPEDEDRFVVSIAPVYGHNFLEEDSGETEDDLAGLEFTFNALPGFLGGLSLKQGVFHSFNAVDEGFAGRSVLSLDFAPDLGVVRPRLSLNGGGVYGHGVQDGFVVGPELALDINLFGASPCGRRLPTTTSSATRTGTRASSGPAWTSASASERGARGRGRDAAGGGPLSPRALGNVSRQPGFARVARRRARMMKPAGTG